MSKSVKNFLCADKIIKYGNHYARMPPRTLASMCTDRLKLSYRFPKAPASDLCDKHRKLADEFPDVCVKNLCDRYVASLAAGPEPPKYRGPPDMPSSSLCDKHKVGLCDKHRKLLFDLPRTPLSGFRHEELLSKLPKDFECSLADLRALRQSLPEPDPLAPRLVRCFGESPMTSPAIWHVGSPEPSPGISLPTGAPHPRMDAPTAAPNKVKVIQDTDGIWKVIRDPKVRRKKIEHKPSPGGSAPKEAVRMIVIRRRKMRKHKLRKLRKRMKFIFAKVKLKRALRKEGAFRTELLSRVEAADTFDPEAHVNSVLDRLRHHAKPEALDERTERYRRLKKVNRYKTNFIRPRFDD